MILPQILAKGLKADCVNDYIGVKVQALVHQESIRFSYQKKNANIVLRRCEHFIRDLFPTIF